MARRILLAHEFSERLDLLARGPQEVNGVLLYARKGTLCPIEYLFITGQGDERHVSADPQHILILNAFFRSNHSYRVIKFHTHTSRTMQRFGQHHNTNFSRADIREYDKQLQYDPEFIGMVVTPHTKLLYAPDHPTLHLIEGFPKVADDKIQNELQAIARMQGYELAHK